MKVVAVDVGSVSKKRFAWWASDMGEYDARDLSALNTYLRQSLDEGQRLALGLECPLVLPVPHDHSKLGARRAAEGTRAWSAGAGASAMGTGLVQLAWILAELGDVRVTTQVDRWDQDVPLLIWEAFVSGEFKSNDDGTDRHVADARAAVWGFVRALGRGGYGRINVGQDRALNLAVAAALQAGALVDPMEISMSLLVADGFPGPANAARVLTWPGWSITISRNTDSSYGLSVIDIQDDQHAEYHPLLDGLTFANEDDALGGIRSCGLGTDVIWA